MRFGPDCGNSATPGIKAGLRVESSHVTWQFPFLLRRRRSALLGGRISASRGEAARPGLRGVHHYLLVQIPEQSGLVFESGIGPNEPDRILARGYGYELFPEAGAGLAAVVPQFIVAHETVIASRGAPAANPRPLSKLSVLTPLRLLPACVYSARHSDFV